MKFASFLCWLNRHKPDRSQVHWDGRHFTGQCLHCGKPVRRLRKGRWIEDRAKGGE